MDDTFAIRAHEDDAFAVFLKHFNSIIHPFVEFTMEKYTNNLLLFWRTSETMVVLDTTYIKNRLTRIFTFKKIPTTIQYKNEEFSYL